LVVVVIKVGRGGDKNWWWKHKKSEFYTEFTFFWPEIVLTSNFVKVRFLTKFHFWALLAKFSRWGKPEKTQKSDFFSYTGWYRQNGPWTKLGVF